MSEIRTAYRLGQLELNGLNRILSQVADRLDELEGRRGTPLFKSAIDLDGNRATNAAAAIEGTDLIQALQVSPEIQDILTRLGDLTAAELSTLSGILAGVQGQLDAKAEVAGNSGELQYNAAGELGGAANLTYDDTTGEVTIGGAVSHAVVEADGTLRLEADATGWKDVFFPQGVPKTTGAGNPTLATWNGNLRGYSYAINDAHDFDPQEYPHDAKEGATGSWHVHWVSREDVGAARYVKFQIEYAQANPTEDFPGPSTISAEEEVAANTPVGRHFLTAIGTFTALDITSMMAARLTRIVASSTAPGTDPVVLGLHYHYEADTPAGSRLLMTK